MMKILVILVLVVLISSTVLAAEKEYPPYDGWYNNRAHPEWGAVDMPMTRRLPSHYQDGVYQPSGWMRPNPRTISEQLMKGDTGRNSYQNKTAFLVFFGQQIVEEILDAQRPGCPPEYFNIPIPEGDQEYDKDSTGTQEIPILRSRYNQAITGFSPNFPRQQLNEITSFLDGGLTYGITKAWSDALRLFNCTCQNRTTTSNILASQNNPTDCRGELASDKDEGRFPIRNTLGLPMANPPPPREHELKDARRFFRLGNPRGNENPFLLTFGMLWFRHHNWLARKIRDENPNYSDEKVYNEARILNIATHQKIVFYDWLPIFIGICDVNSTDTCHEVPEYTGYKPSVHPGITHVFQSAAMRFGHTLVPPGVFRRTKYNEESNSCEFINTTLFTAGEDHSFQEVHVGKPALRTCNTYFNAMEAVEETDIHSLLMGMASQISEREDNVVTPDLRGSVFGPLEFSRRDLMAINIQRGRDHGLPDYNTAREYLGLKRRKSFLEVNSELFNDEDRNGPELLEKFLRVHDGNLENIDIWTGGLLETRRTGPGELFRAVILDQFVRIRDGDRFWFENKLSKLFNEEELAFIWNTTIKDVVLRTNPGLNENDIQNNPFVWNESDPNARCPQPFPLSELHMEECTEKETFDYFSGSGATYFFTYLAIGFYIVFIILALRYLGRRSDNIRAAMRKETVARNRLSKQPSVGENATVVQEVTGKQHHRQIQIKLEPGKLIQIHSAHGEALRTIDLSISSFVALKTCPKGKKHIFIVSAENDSHDLVLRFNDIQEKQRFYNELKTYLGDHSIPSVEENMQEHVLLNNANTKEKRDEMLQNFFRDAIKASLKLKGQSTAPISNDDRKYINLELSKRELAYHLKLKPNSMFVNQMFDLADTDKNGFISFREFLNIIVLFAKGSAEHKAKLMFDMYDLDKNGVLTKQEVRTMFQSMMEMANADVKSKEVDQVVDNMMNEHGFGNKDVLTLKDFQSVMTQYSTELNDAALFLPETSQKTSARNRNKIVKEKPSRAQYREENDGLLRNSFGVVNDIDFEELEVSRKRSVTISAYDQVEVENKYVRGLVAAEKFIANYYLEIFWLTLYSLVLLAIFTERVYFFSVEREHIGLRRIVGYGVSLTRGAASAMMFTYSSLLVTMCRNTISALRETFLHRYIPFDSAVAMHRIIAYMALGFTILHIVGHAFNFYSISTQPASDLACLFRDYWRQSDVLPKFHYWCWHTVTGLAGVICTLLVVVIYMFSTNYARQRVFRWFWWTHHIGVLLFYLFIIVHGSGFLVQRPFFYYFFLGPLVMFILDKLYSISRNKVEISVLKAELLPSDVVCIEFKRPKSLDYLAGQWVRIACLSQSPNEYHPFTLTSSPDEKTLQVHIRTVGPWTMNLRNIYDAEVLRDAPYPKLYLDGPFGEGHQDWYKYEVSVLVGGGIGVTPFASILKDLVYKSKIGYEFRCKKVFFLWVTRNQRQYEWFTDIIQQVESQDVKDILETHIFITQIPQKYDLRTTMLYICERHFQKIAGKSLFTGLRSVTHFGRPDFKSFFQSLSEEYNMVEKIGIFSCGPRPMTQAVESACARVNVQEGPGFKHHSENF